MTAVPGYGPNSIGNSWVLLHICRSSYELRCRYLGFCAWWFGDTCLTAATAIALFLLTMDVDITQPTLSSVGTVWVVTELIMWVHRQSPLDASSKLHLKDLPWIHPFSTSSITHHG